MSNIEPALRAFRIAKPKTVANGLINTVDRIFFCKTFFSNRLVVGSFFSCIYNGNLRIHSVLNEETEYLHDEISELIEKSMERAGTQEGMIWVRAANKKFITYLNDRFSIVSDSEEFFYYSTEYIMHRSKFNKEFDSNLLTVKPYEESHIDKYLEVLSDSMSFFIPPEDFVLGKPRYMQEFMEYKNKNTFETFWKESELAGLYWNDGIEVDTMGVSSNFQRSGYGSAILTRAIENIFLQNPETEYALLYCVGWNTKAQNFYKKYGMEINAIHKVPYDNVNT